jgi:hypothetical protein
MKLSKVITVFICSLALAFSTFCFLPGSSNKAFASTLPAYQYTKDFDTQHGQVDNTKVATDSNGNIYLMGYFLNSVVFGGTDSFNSPADDMFITKYNANGSYAWTKVDTVVNDQGMSSEGVVGNSIAVDSNGNIYVAGDYNGTVNLGGGSNISCNSMPGSYSQACAFVAKYDTNGNYLWSNISTPLGDESPGSAYVDANGVTTDSSGNVDVTGDIYNSVNFGGSSDLSSPKNTGAYVVQYSSSGAYNWGEAFIDGSGAYSSGYSVSTDSSGNVYVAGVYYNTVTFGGTDSSTSANTGSFITKYSGGGSYDWTNAIVSNSNSNWVGFNDSLTNSSGDTYVTGVFKGSIDFGGSYTLDEGNDSIFTAEYNPSGQIVWAVEVGASYYAQGSAIALDSNGNVFIDGYFYDTISLDGYNLVSSGSNANSFVIEYSSTGDYKWSQEFDNTNGMAQAFGIALNSTDGLYLSGNYHGTVSFDGPGGSSTYSATGGQDAYLTSYQVTPLPVSGTSATSSTANSSITAPDTGYGNNLANPLGTLLDYFIAFLSLVSLAFILKKTIYSSKKL